MHLHRVACQVENKNCFSPKSIFCYLKHLLVSWQNAEGRLCWQHVGDHRDGWVLNLHKTSMFNSKLRRRRIGDESWFFDNYIALPLLLVPAIRRCNF